MTKKPNKLRTPLEDNIIECSERAYEELKHLVNQIAPGHHLDDGTAKTIRASINRFFFTIMAYAELVKTHDSGLSDSAANILTTIGNQTASLAKQFALVTAA